MQKLQQFMKITSNSEQEKTRKSSEKQTKTSFPKEQVENTDLYKPLSSKVMITQE